METTGSSYEAARDTIMETTGSSYEAARDTIMETTGSSYEAARDTTVSLLNLGKTHHYEALEIYLDDISRQGLLNSLNISLWVHVNEHVQNHLAACGGLGLPESATAEFVLIKLEAKVENNTGSRGGGGGGGGGEAEVEGSSAAIFTMCVVAANSKSKRLTFYDDPPCKSFPDKAQCLQWFHLTSFIAVDNRNARKPDTSPAIPIETAENYLAGVDFGGLSLESNHQQYDTFQQESFLSRWVELNNGQQNSLTLLPALHLFYGTIPEVCIREFYRDFSTPNEQVDSSVLRTNVAQHHPLQIVTNNLAYSILNTSPIGYQQKPLPSHSTWKKFALHSLVPVGIVLPDETQQLFNRHLAGSALRISSARGAEMILMFCLIGTIDRNTEEGDSMHAVWTQGDFFATTIEIYVGGQRRDFPEVLEKIQRARQLSNRAYFWYTVMLFYEEDCCIVICWIIGYELLRIPETFITFHLRTRAQTQYSISRNGYLVSNTFIPWSTRGHSVDLDIVFLCFIYTSCLSEFLILIRSHDACCQDQLAQRRRVPILESYWRYSNVVLLVTADLQRNNNNELTLQWFDHVSFECETYKPESVQLQWKYLHLSYYLKLSQAKRDGQLTPQQEFAWNKLKCIKNKMQRELTTPDFKETWTIPSTSSTSSSSSSAKLKT